MGPIALATIRTSAVFGLRLLVQAGSLLLLARMLGPQDYGAFAGISALAVTLGTLSTFGMHLVLLGEIARDPARRDYVLARVMPVTLVCGTFLLLVFLLVSLAGLREAGVSLWVLLPIGATETLLQPLFNLPASELLARGRVARSQLLATLPLALRLAVAVCVVLRAPSNPLAVYAYAYLAVLIVALVIVSLVMRQPWPAPSAWRWPDKSEWHEAAGYAALNVTAAGPAELDKTLATRLLPLADSGVYAAGQRAVSAVILPIGAMMLSALPRLFREGCEQSQRTDRLLRWMLTVTLIYSVALATALWFCAPALAWLFGTKYRDIPHMIHWLCLAVPGMSLRIACGIVLMAFGKPWMRVCFELSGLVVLGIASPILIVHLGAIGMPLALAGSETMMAVIGMLLVVHARKSRRMSVKLA